MNLSISKIVGRIKSQKGIKEMFVLREMCTFIQGIGAGNIGKTSLFTFSLYGIYKGSARYNVLLHAAYYMMIKKYWLMTLNFDFDFNLQKVSL